jgi:hypothetical protein
MEADQERLTGLRIRIYFSRSIYEGGSNEF